MARNSASGIRMSPVQYEMVRLQGGLDMITPTLELGPGVLRQALNFECSVTGGYSRIGGYERYDGQASPSAASYIGLSVTYTGATPVPYNQINGLTSGATGYVIATGPFSVVVTKVTGVFQAGETLRVGATAFATLTAITGANGSPFQAAVYTALAANYYRSLITQVPGSGPVRGVIQYNGVVYAFRNNAGGTAIGIYKSTASGWAAVPLFYEVAFTTGGAVTPLDGATLTQGGVTATVKRVAAQTGAWGSTTAAGKFVISAPAGGNFAAGAATLTGGATVSLTGIQTAITLLPGGHFEFVVANFGGSTGTSKAYGCDGVNRAFEFDGTTLAPITTGMPTDTPKHIAAFKNKLFLSFDASAQFSTSGAPFGWSAILGAGEFSAGETITNYILLPGNQSGGALLIQTRNNTLVLYGSSATDFNLVSYNVGVGAIAYTAENMAGIYSLDDRGVMGLNATLAYGNFDQATLTANLRPFTIANRTFAQASSVSREKSQYRVFFSNGFGLYCTIVNDKYMGSVPVFFPDAVFCTWEGEDTIGNETAFYGSANGYVHQLDVGTSFDGQAINAYITLNYNAIKGPRLLKRFRKASAEITGTSYAQIAATYSLGYNSATIAPQAAATYAVSFALGAWDSGITWDSGIVWDGSTLAPSEIELQGTAENISITLSSNTDYSLPFTVNSLIIHYTPRRGIR